MCGVSFVKPSSYVYAIYKKDSGEYKVSESCRLCFLEYSSPFQEGHKTPMDTFLRKNYCVKHNKTNKTNRTILKILSCFFPSIQTSGQYILVERNRTSLLQVCLFNFFSLCTLFLILGVQYRVAPEFAADATD